MKKNFGNIVCIVNFDWMGLDSRNIPGLWLGDERDFNFSLVIGSPDWSFLWLPVSFRAFMSIVPCLGMWCVWLRRGGCIGSCWGNWREGDHWGDLGIDGWIILGWISRGWDVDIRTGLGSPRIDRWRTLVSAVMNLRAPWNAGNFLTSCKAISFSRRTLHYAVST